MAALSIIASNGCLTEARIWASATVTLPCRTSSISDSSIVFIPIFFPLCMMDPIIGVLAALFVGGAVSGASLRWAAGPRTLGASLVAIVTWGFGLALGGAAFSVLLVFLGQLAKPLLGWALTENGASAVGVGLSGVLAGLLVRVVASSGDRLAGAVADH